MTDTTPSNVRTSMNTALWRKSFNDSKWLLLGSMLLMFVVHWVRVWLASQLPLSNLRVILGLLPPFAEKISPVPLEQIATPVGRIAIAYDDPTVLLLVTVWAIARGSDAVSGEINRGTMELLLAQPISRLRVLATQANVTILGAVILAATAWLGTAIGLLTVRLDEPVSAKLFVPAALNLCALTIFLAGLTTMVSSCDQYRWRTIGVVGAFYAIQLVMKVIGRAADGFQWLNPVTFFSAFEPQLITSQQEQAWSLWYHTLMGSWRLGGLGCDAVLICLGFLCYAIAAGIFCYRDMPAPL